MKSPRKRFRRAPEFLILLVWTGGHCFGAPIAASSSLGNGLPGGLALTAAWRFQNITNHLRLPDVAAAAAETRNIADVKGFPFTTFRGRGAGPKTFRGGFEAKAARPPGNGKIHLQRRSAGPGREIFNSSAQFG